MPSEVDKRIKVCGYCGKKLGTNAYKEMQRVRGWFCSPEHCVAFIENDFRPIVSGLKEDETETLYKVQQDGASDYADRDRKRKGDKHAK